MYEYPGAEIDHVNVTMCELVNALHKCIEECSSVMVKNDTVI